jgi:hypothetical protein
MVSAMKQRHIEVEVVGTHVRMRVGQTYMHSEQYSTEANALRAARGIVKAINTRPMQLIFWKGRTGSKKRVVELVRKAWTTGGGRTVALPVDAPLGTSYFDPTQEVRAFFAPVKLRRSDV